MNELLREPFQYSAWATKTLLAACRKLTTEQLRRPACSFGSVLATLNHVVVSDANYVAMLSGHRPAWVVDGKDADDLDQIEARADEAAQLWEQFLADPLDPDRLLLLDAGEYECHASVVVAQALHHANAHREQVRASLRACNVSPPDLQPWEYALATGRARWRREDK